MHLEQSSLNTLRSYTSLIYGTPPLFIPLTTLLHHKAQAYLCISLPPFSTSSLLTGSSNNLRTFHTSPLLHPLATYFHLKPHQISQNYPQTSKTSSLPYTIKTHVVSTDLNDLSFEGKPELSDSAIPHVWIESACGLLPPFPRINPEKERDLEEGEYKDLCKWSLCLREEMIAKGEEANVECSECHEFIRQNKFYYATLRQQQYYCCMSCYAELLPTQTYKLNARLIHPHDSY